MGQYLTKYGNPYGVIPGRPGNVYYVAPAATYTIAGPAGGRSYSASDDLDGLSPERALRTLARAIALATANAGDSIVLLPGTHTVTATVAINKAGLTIWGTPSRPDVFNTYAPDTILASTGTSDELLNITAGNLEIGYLSLRGTSAFSAVSFQTTGALSGIYFHHCYFDMNTPAVSTATIGLDVSNRLGGVGNARLSGTESVISGLVVEDCVFESDGAQGAAVHLATCYAVFRRCHIFNTAGTWASPFTCATGTDNTVIDQCIWSTSGTMTLAIDGYFATAADGVFVTRTNFSRATAVIDGFAANEIQLSQNYNPTSGGTLVTIG